MEILSYSTQDPKCYQAGKKVNKAIFESRSEIGLIGDIIDVESGEWVSTQSHIHLGKATLIKKRLKYIWDLNS